MNRDRDTHELIPDDSDLYAAAERLGRAAADRLDLDATARTVLTRLREPSRRGMGSRVGARGLRVAAVLAVIIGGALGARELLRSPAERGVALPAGAELSELGTGDLELLLASLDDVLQVEAAEVGEDLGDLTEEELRVVLQSLEG